MPCAGQNLCRRRIHAAFVNEVTEQRLDGPIIGAANDGCRLTLLRHESLSISADIDDATGWKPRCQVALAAD